VREFLLQENPTLVCLQETKLSTVCNSLGNEILGAAFDYVFLPSTEASGGIILGWRRDLCSVTDVTRGRFSLSGREAELGSERAAWWITVVYGPQLDNDKIEFQGELL
jgi:hypothetical protein